MNIDRLPITKRIDEIVRIGLHPHLKQIGFKKRGRTFRRQQDDCWQIVAVSGGMHNTNLGAGSVGSFSVEMGIHFPPVFSIDRVDLVREPRIHECYVYDGLALPYRVGFFDDLQGGFPTTLEQTQAVSHAWCEQGEPWFSRYSDPVAAYEWTRAKDNWREAMCFAIYLDDKKGAAEALANCRRVWGGMLITHIEAIAAKHGVVTEQPD